MRSHISVLTRRQGPHGARYRKPAYQHLDRDADVSCATVFRPQFRDETPESHFPLQTVIRLNQPRFINRYDSREILIVVDGSCWNNGHSVFPDLPSTGGCSFVFKGGHGGAVTTYPFLQDGSDQSGTIGFPLEMEGPDGHYYDPTSNAAKLRAVIAALEFRPWHLEGWRRIIIATDLAYVVKGATEWLPRWVAKGWRKGRGKGSMPNRALWEKLHAVMKNLKKHNTEVSFWLITRNNPASHSGYVKNAKSAAREAAAQQGFNFEWNRLSGINV
ncbi:hypothetical protein BJ166DRAFT_148314 [Pestalotiopsis sp. NC0098]|nr:hypothetical protein BJ166DRAFT_148314 [Pestalotiopsis sp. NC0098]